MKNPQNYRGGLFTCVIAYPFLIAK